MGTSMQRVPLDGVELEVAVQGSGEPVVLIQTALVADELFSLAGEPVLRDRYRVIGYHRRGYAGSAPAQGAASIDRDAADCRALLAALGVERAHVVGYSYSVAVALQLAVDAPGTVHTLALFAPPPMTVPSTQQLIEAAAPALQAYHAGDLAGAVDSVMTLVAGPNWRTILGRRVPGGPEQAEKDAATFFESDIPALQTWQFGADDARLITQPVLHMDGSESGPLFAEVHDLLHAWLPQTEDVMLAGANHAFAITHPTEAATALAAFLKRHPIAT